MVTIRLRRISLLLLVLFLALPLKAERKKFERMPSLSVFVPKGQVLMGGMVGCSSDKISNVNFLVLKNISASGLSISAAPYIGYFVADNFAIGARFKYNRSMYSLDNLNLGLGEDMNISLSDLNYINQKYNGILFGRYYMSIAGSKMFGMFAEMRLAYSYSEGKNSTGKGDAIDGTYQQSNAVGLYVNPGLAVFLTNFTAVEVSVGIFGVDYRWQKQVHNQIDSGYIKNMGADFKINPLSINLGVSFFF